jgi:hypothetical protein
MAIFSLLPWRAGARPADPAKSAPQRSDPPKSDPPKSDSPKSDPPKSAPAEPAAVFAAFVTALERLDPCGTRFPARPRPVRSRRPAGR